MWTADPMLSSDEVGRKLRVWSLSGMGMIPGRRATMEKASPVAEGKFIGSQSIFAMVLLWFMDCWSPSLSSSWCSGSGGDERWVKKAVCEQAPEDILIICYLVGIGCAIVSGHLVYFSRIPRVCAALYLCLFMNTQFPLKKELNHDHSHIIYLIFFAIYSLVRTNY
jgi:hypothetical protein